MSSWKRAARAAAIVFLAGCAGDAGSVVGPSGGPSETISDAAHAGAVPGFYFLPPMVKMPAFSGTFDAGLSPRVEICELAGSACATTLGVYTRTSGVGGATIGVDSVAGQYAVNWHTNLFNLDPAKHYRISVFVDSLRLGFADVDVVSSGRELKNVNTQEYIPLQDGRTLPVKFRIERGIVGKVIVSPAADTVNVGGTAQFTATLNDLHGNPLPGPAVTWSSSNTAVATIDGSGLATGVAPGTVTITASVGYLSGTATLVVEQPNQPPVAGADTFEAIGNVTVPVAAPGVLANATDPDGDALSAVAGTFPTTGGGTVTIAADGSFTYLSAPGFTGTDSFQFSVTDGIDTAAGTATVEAPTRVWYVSNAGGAPGDGRDASPFVTLKAAEAASAPGETIFLLSGDGSTAGYDEGIVLKAGQSLTGQGVAADVVVTLNGQPVTLLDAGATPTVTRNDAGMTVQLATGNTVQGVNVASSAGAGIAGSGFGTLTASVGAVAANGGPALDLENGTVAATFASLSSVGSVGAGLRLVGLSGALTAPAGAIGGAAGAGVEIAGGDATIAYGGSVTGSGARAADISGRTGGSVTLSGDLTDTGLGVRVQNNTGGTIAFTGGSKSFSTGANDAVTLSGNTGATVQFAGGGLAVATTTGAGFSATGGGTLTVTGAQNTIASAGGVALRVENTTIGASGLTFHSVSANGGPNGIVLVNTGAANGLQVTGDGSTAGSGGTIQNVGGADGSTEGIGVYLSGVRNVSLARMIIQDAQNFGIRGVGVNGFSMSHTAVAGAHGTSGVLEEASVAFNGLTGSATIANSSVSGGRADNFRVVNAGGVLDRLTFSNTTIGLNSAAEGDEGLALEATGGAVLNVTVQNSTFLGARAEVVQALAAAGATMDLVFTANTISNTHPSIVAASGGVLVFGAGTVSYQFSGNTFRDAVGTALLVNASGAAAAFSGRIENNQVGVAGVPNSGSASASGIQVESNAGGDHTVLIDGNVVRGYNSHGIHLRPGDALGSPVVFNATVTGNTVTNPGTINTNFNGLHLNNGVVSADGFTSCVDIRGNTLAGSGAGSSFPNNADFRLRQRFATTVRLPGYAGAANDNAAVVAFVQANNAGAPSGNAANSVPTGGGFVGGAACAQP